MELCIQKAEQVGEDKVLDVSINIKHHDELTMYQEHIGTFQFHNEQGEDIELFLRRSLPGGTYDALLRHMLLNRASKLVVSFK